MPFQEKKKEKKRKKKKSQVLYLHYNTYSLHFVLSVSIRLYPYRNDMPSLDTYSTKKDRESEAFYVKIPSLHHFSFK